MLHETWTLFTNIILLLEISSVQDKEKGCHRRTCLMSQDWQFELLFMKRKRVLNSQFMLYEYATKVDATTKIWMKNHFRTEYM